ncbi:glutathione S-transferase, partial [Vibrio sp. V1B]
YGIELSEGAKAYQQKVLASEALQQWLEEASQETDIVEEDEAGVEA